MTVPEGLPVKLYTGAQQTFNEFISDSVPGIDKKLFLQKYTLTNNIRLQLVDTVNKATRVSIINEATGEEIGTKDFTVTGTADGNYRYDITFTLTELGVVSGQKVVIEVYQDDTEIVPAVEAVTGDMEWDGLLGTMALVGTVS